MLDFESRFSVLLNFQYLSPRVSLPAAPDSIETAGVTLVLSHSSGAVLKCMDAGPREMLICAACGPLPCHSFAITRNRMGKYITVLESCIVRSENRNFGCLDKLWCCARESGSGGGDF